MACNINGSTSEKKCDFENAQSKKCVQCGICGDSQSAISQRVFFDDEMLCSLCNDLLIDQFTDNNDDVVNALTHYLKRNFVVERPQGDFLVEVDDREPNKVKRVRFALSPQLQSGKTEPIPTDISEVTQDIQENIQFFDDQPEKSLLYGVPVSDDTYTRGYQKGADLGEFLQRPVEIFSFDWALGTPVTAFRFSPWDKYLSNAYIADKLKTYKLLRGTLHIKILINGSPFHYGKLFVGMRPTRYTNNTVDLSPDDSVTITNYLTSGSAYAWQPNRVLYSSRPHVFLNPTKNTPVHIHWPFMSAQEYIEVNNSDDYDRLGYLEVWELNTLQTATQGSTAGDLTVSFFAWMDNVELTGITPLYAQSGKSRKKKSSARSSKPKKDDEFNGDGIISGPATAIAGIAERLVDIPIIGKFAKATEIGASAVSNIAKLFGFSNPTIVDKICMKSSLQLGRMAHVNGADPIVKLSLDPKNELTIDPSTVGLPNEDEMSFMSVAKREALFAQAVWSSGISGRICGWRVNPLVGPKFPMIVNANTDTMISLTPLGFVSYPFEYWTGSLVFRIQCVCSQFHRGRLAVVYTPDVATTVNSAPMPAHFVHIIDLSRETDASFQVNWAQPWAWGRIYDKRSSLLADTLDVSFFTDAGNFTNDPYINNGRIDLIVINELATPNDSGNIEINLYVRAGDDFQVASPTTVNGLVGDAEKGSTWTSYEGVFDLVVQSGNSVMVGGGAYNALAEEDIANQDEEYILNGDNPNGTNLNLVYMGEDIRSIRSMIKRYTSYVTTFDMSSGNNTIFSLVMPDFPIAPSSGGYGSSGLLDTTLGQTSFVPMTYLRYYCQGFVGYRGSVKYKVVLSTNNNVGFMAATRIPSTTNAYSIVANQLDMVTADSADIKQVTLASAPSSYLSQTGVTIMDGRSSNTLAYELPFYYPIRYAELHRTSYVLTSPEPTNNWAGHTLAINVGLNSNFSSLPTAFAQTYVAAGEDLSFFFFIGVPPLTVEVAIV